MVLGFWSRDKKNPNPQMKRFVVISCVALLLGVAGLALWRIIPSSETFFTDADTIKQPIAEAHVRDILWQPPSPLSELINTTADDYEPRLSADGLTLFFVRGKAGENAEIFTSQKTYAGWSDPKPIAAINSEADDLGPEPSKDGNALYFYSNRDGTFGGYDLWVARFKSDTWTTPVNLGPNVNSPFNDYGPALAADGATLYFSSNRPQLVDEESPDPDAWSATLREDLFHRTYDLYAATINDRGIGKATPIIDLNTPFNEGAPAVTPFGDFLYFSSDRPGGEGGFDLYRSRYLHGGYREATNLGSPINTASNELDPALAMGGYALYFSSDRPDYPNHPEKTLLPDGKEVGGVTEPAASQRQTYDLFYSTSREVFADTQRSERDRIDWAALWGVIGPNLLWALLALLLLLAMLSLYRAMHDRKISLLAKCLLASLAAHLLLLMLMNAWEVAAAIAGEFNRRGTIRVALASPSSGDAIASQIRGELIQIDLPDVAPPIPRRRIESATTPNVQIDSATLFVDRSHLAEIKAGTKLVKIAEAASRPRSESVIPDRSVEIVQASLTLAATLPNEQSRMDTAEKPPERRVEAEQATLTVRADVNTPTRRDPAHIDMRPTQSAIEFSQASQGSAQVNVLEIARDQRDHTPTEKAFVDSRLSEKAARVVDAELVSPATPRDDTRMSHAAELQVHAPRAELASQQQRVEVPRGVIASVGSSAPANSLAAQTSRALLDDSMISNLDLAAGVLDAVVTDTVLIPDTVVMVVSASPITLASELAIPSAERIGRNRIEEPTADVKARPSESLRPSPSRDITKMVEASSARVDSTVAPSEMPVEHFPESVVLADAQTADRPRALVAAATLRDHVVPPPLLAAAALPLPALNRKVDVDVEAAAPEVDPGDALPERLRSEVLVSTATPAPTADALFTETIVPANIWQDAPIPDEDGVRPQEITELPLQPLLVNSLRVATANVAIPELKIETLAEEIEPQLPSDDPRRNEVIGMLRGQITDKETGEPLAGAQVRLTLPLVGSIVAEADRRGRYTLNVPDVPDFFAVSATLDGYVPETKSVSRDRVEGRRLRVNFELTPQDRAILVTEAIPDVHHLGDNRFEGRINSQFQKESEGDRYKTTFTLRSDQLPPDVSGGEVILLAKGVQRSHRIVINGETLDDRLDDTPSDGSFGEFVARFDVSILREGENTLEIIAKPSSSDIDDFEFVNVRVRLIQ